MVISMQIIKRFYDGLMILNVHVFERSYDSYMILSYDKVMITNKLRLQFF